MTAQADVADEAQVQAMFAAAVREFGTVDILVSNAGMERNAPFHEMTTAQWDAVMNVNLRGAFLCAREAVREFLRRGVRPEVSVGGRQDHLHQLGARSHSVGRPRELRRIEGRPDAADEEPGAGGRGEAHPRQFHRARCDSHADQHGRVVDAGSLRRPHEAGALQADRRGGGDRPRRGLARVGLHRLPRRNDALHRRRHDACIPDSRQAVRLAPRDDQRRRED